MRRTLQLAKRQNTGTTRNSGSSLSRNARVKSGPPPRNAILGSGDASSGGAGGDAVEPIWRSAASRMIEGCATAFGSILILGIAGYSYNVYYKSYVLSKMENAFALGYSSVEMAALSRHVDAEGSHAALLQAETFEDNDWIPRDEQAVIDSIVDGTMRGQYHLITGEKGTGKTSMLLKAMGKIGGEGVAMFEAHGDPEIFRVRLGKALDFEFHEDYVGSLFSFKGQRDATALLDIERAFNKMEKIALRRKEKVGKPLVLIITGAHLIRDDEDGQDLLELIQQRAELWAASNLVTVIFNSDDYWTTERLMWQATRLRVTPVRDIPKDVAIKSLRQFRESSRGEHVPTDVLEQVYSMIGGRLSFITRAAKSSDMLRTCNAICEKEKRWLLNKCWILGADMDPGAENEQDLSSAAMLLAKALIEKEEAMRAAGTYDGKLPHMPLHKARELITNSEWIKMPHHHNIFTIDPDGMVQADSVAMYLAMKEVCGAEGFDEHLRATLERLDEIESLQRTREVTLKDLTGNEQEYRATVAANGEGGKAWSLKLVPSGSAAK